MRTRDGFNYLCTMENTGGEDQGWVQVLVYNGEYRGVRTRDGFKYLCTMENTGGEDQGWVQVLVYNGEYRG